MLFPEDSYQLSANGKAALNQYVPRLQALQNAKVVIYDYTDNLPVGPQLQRAGIANNIDLSSKRADAVVAYFRSQGVNPNILSAKGFGDTHAVVANDTPQGRAQNRRIEIALEGPGACRRHGQIRSTTTGRVCKWQSILVRTTGLSGFCQARPAKAFAAIAP